MKYWDCQSTWHVDEAEIKGNSRIEVAMARHICMYLAKDDSLYVIIFYSPCLGRSICTVIHAEKIRK